MRRSANARISSSTDILASKGRFYRAGEPIPEDVSVPPFAEKCHRIREDEQPDESDSSSNTVDDEETTERLTRDGEENRVS